jgi:hypothetical protein
MIGGATLELLVLLISVFDPIIASSLYLYVPLLTIPEPERFPWL